MAFMEQGFIDILQKLIEEQGKETLLNASKCKGFLADYTKNEYKKESRFLLQAIDAGVQRAINTSRELPICKKQQIRLLREDYGLDEKIAADVVDTLAFVLRGDTTVTEIEGTDNVPGKDQTVKKKPSAPAAVPTAAPGIEPLVKRGYLFLEDAEWKQADTYFDRVLDMDPEYAPAYTGKLCCELNVRQEEQLAQNEKPLTGYGYYQKAVRFADEDYRVQLEQYNKTILVRIVEEERLKRAEKEKLERIEKERLAKEKAEREARAEQAERERLEREKLAKKKAEQEARAAETAEQLTKVRERIAKYQMCISLAPRHTVGLKADGTVVARGDNKYGECNVSDWRGIVAVAAGGYHTVGLKKDGSVVAVGEESGGQFISGVRRDIVVVGGGQCNVSDWRGIAAVAAGGYHTVGLKKGGTVVAVGENKYGQCDVSGWRDIVAVAAGDDYTVGLKADGTVVAVGNNETRDFVSRKNIHCGQCDVSGWRNIVAVAAGSSHTVGLKSDGTVVAVGGNIGQCDVSGWRNIAAVAAGSSHTVGLKTDGTVVEVGSNNRDQCDVSGWRDIVAVAASSDYTVGLKEDGTVVALRSNSYNQYYNFYNIGYIGPVSEKQVKELTEREAKELAEREAKKAQSLRWQAQGLCENCGGKMSVLTRKCKNCGWQKYTGQAGLCRYCGGSLELYTRICKKCGREN